jgi:ppGpp synthetase/RelA/SpoT-type nucleotidyltranferase
MQQKPLSLAVCGLITDAAGQYLLIRRSQQSRHNAGLWEPPGGKCEPGETIDAALRREVREETGLDVHLTRVLGASHLDLPEGTVACLLVETQLDGGQFRLSAEHDDHRWLPRAQLGGLPVPEHFREFLRQLAILEPSAKVEHIFNKEWYQRQIARFKEQRPMYEKLAGAMRSVLQQATERLGMLAIVQVRAKTLPSFAEKIIRKSYTDPFAQMTDFCGARVITLTLNEVAALSRFVETHFHVFPEDSEDKLEKLAATEFGYRSRHYVVAFNPGVFPNDVVPPDLIGPQLKVELQIRTVLQHAWADISHQFSYKNRFELPRHWQREFGRLAAILEEADQSFESIRAGLQEYAASYGSYYSQERLRSEIEKQAIILEAVPGNTEGALHLARMAMCEEDWARAVKVLEPFAASGVAPLLRDLGVSMCKLHAAKPHDEDFRNGQSYLKRATELDPSDGDAWASLGGTWRVRENAANDVKERAEYREQARRCYCLGFEKDPTNPYPLGNYIEYEVADHPDLDVASYFRPSLEAASRRCKLQAEVGINMPWVYFDLGKFELLLRRPYAALGYYGAGVAQSSAAFFLDSALKSFQTLEKAGASWPGFDWSRRYLQLAKSVRFGQPDEIGLPANLENEPLKPPVVIVCGYSDRQVDVDRRALLLSAFRGFQGTLISSGAETGIGAVIGELQAARPAAVHVVGYAPQKLPPSVKLDIRYGEHRRSSGVEMSPLEPIQYWTDLNRSGISPWQVKVLAVGGDRITTCECQIALALGAAVAVVESPVGEPGASLTDMPWSTIPLLQWLPADSQALQTFLGK